MGQLGFNTNNAAVFHARNTVSEIENSVIMGDDNQGPLL
jgi:hypothetical protein